MFRMRTHHMTVLTAALVLGWALSSRSDAAPRPEPAPQSGDADVPQPNMIVNPGFEMGLKGWEWEFNSFQFPEGIFEATGNVSIGTSDLTANRWAEMNAFVRAQTVAGFGVAGGQSELVIHQAFEYDHNSLLPVVRHDGLVSMTSLALNALLTENAKVGVTVSLELENLRNKQNAITNVVSHDIIGPCPDEPITQISGLQTWRQTRLMVSMVDAIEGDQLVARLRVTMRAEASGPNAAAQLLTQTRVDSVSIVEFTSSEVIAGTAATAPMFSATRPPVEDADEATFADMGEAAKLSFSFDTTVRDWTAGIVRASDTTVPGSAAALRAVSIVPEDCRATELECGPIIIRLSD